MKKFLQVVGISLALPTAMLVFNSCAAISSKLATPERIEKLPEPIKSELKRLLAYQKQVERKFTQGTKKMLEAYYTIGDAIGLKKQAMKIKAEADALKDGSSMEDARKALNRSSGLIKEIQQKVSSGAATESFSKEKFLEGYRKKNDAYVIEASLATEAMVQAVKGVQAIKKASPIEKVLLTTSLDPLFFVVRDVPNFLAAERAFDENCQKYAQVKAITLPKASLPTPKPMDLGAF
jgi:hypothetical protein